MLANLISLSILSTLVATTRVYLLTEESDPSLNPTGFIEGLTTYVNPKDKATG
jgi:fluoride ion exporter CrcB/FEX